MVAIKELIVEVDVEKKGSRPYKAWKREITALQTIGRYSHPHIVEVLAIFNQAQKEYFMFPWADGGNLLDFFKRHTDTEANHNPRFVLHIVKQLAGLASAVQTMHKHLYRHGDLKPENILVFNYKKKVGTWKLADLGLAKFHNQATGDRKGPTTMLGNGTISYEPPETVTASESPRSRLYDIWSMGCIILQLVAYLLYGERTIIQLAENTHSPAGKHHSTYWQASWIPPDDRWTDSAVHDEVLRLMDQIEGDFGKDSSAIGTSALIKLVRLVKERLLVVRLSKNWTKPSPPGCRARAEDLHSDLQKLKEELKIEIQKTSKSGHPRPPEAGGKASGSHTSNALQLPGKRSSGHPSGSHVSLCLINFPKHHLSPHPYHHFSMLVAHPVRKGLIRRLRKHI